MYRISDIRVYQTYFLLFSFFFFCKPLKWNTPICVYSSATIKVKFNVVIKTCCCCFIVDGAFIVQFHFHILPFFIYIRQKTFQFSSFFLFFLKRYKKLNPNVRITSPYILVCVCGGYTKHMFNNVCTHV